MKSLSQPKDDAKRVGIWIRVSTEDQAKGESPEHHERRAHYYAESKGWHVREVYHLEAVSGKSVMGQQETERMLADIKAGHITGLIFSKLARLARNTKELLDFADLFREHDADLISLQESIDTSTPAGRLFYTMLAAMAQWEREEIADRVAASVPIRAKLGKPLGGQAPFGYQWHERKLILHADEAPVRKRIYELFAEHRRKKTVARLLNDEGHRTRGGSKFTDTTIDRLLRDPIAKGKRRSNYTKSLGDKKHWVMKSEEEWVYNEVEPIVSEELWEQCNRVLDARRKSGERPAKRAVQLFAGLTFCACGQKMYVPSNTPKYVCYKCRNKLPTSDLEGIFQEQLKGFFFSSTEIVEYLKAADELIKGKQELLQTLEKQRHKIRLSMDKLLRLYMEDGIGRDGFKRENQPLEERLRQLDEQIPQLQSEIDFLTIQYLSSDQIFTEAQNIYARWHDLEHKEKRHIIENIAQKIVVGKDEVSIELCYIPTSEELSKGQRNVRDSWQPPT